MKLPASTAWRSGPSQRDSLRPLGVGHADGRTGWEHGAETVALGLKPREDARRALSRILGARLQVEPNPPEPPLHGGLVDDAGMRLRVRGGGRAFEDVNECGRSAPHCLKVTT